MIIRSSTPSQYLFDHGTDIRETVKVVECRHPVTHNLIQFLVGLFHRFGKRDEAQNQTVESKLGGI